jgi:hypothetical protein
MQMSLNTSSWRSLSQQHIQDGSGYRCAGIEPWKYQCDHAKKIMGHLRTLILWRGNLYSFFLNPQ